MVNPNGLTHFDDGENQYPVKFGTRAYYEFEQKADESFNKVMARFEQGDAGFQDIVNLLWAGMEAGPNADVALDDVTDALDRSFEINGMESTIEQIADAIESGMPSDDLAGDDGDSNLTEQQAAE